MGYETPLWKAEELERGEVTAPSRGNLVIGRVLDNRTLRERTLGLVKSGAQ